jgi:hypothetical protein
LKFVKDAKADDSKRANSKPSHSGKESDDENKPDRFVQVMRMIRTFCYENVMNIAAIYCYIKNIPLDDVRKNNIQYLDILQFVASDKKAFSIFRKHMGLDDDERSVKIMSHIVEISSSKSLKDMLTHNLHSVISETSFGKEWEEDESISDYFYINPSDGKVHTPMSLVDDMMTKLWGEIKSGKNKTFLDPHCKDGGFLRWIHMKLIKEGVQNPEKYLFGIENDPVYVVIARHISGLDNIVVIEDLTSGDIYGKIKSAFKGRSVMKFDVIVGNPPYNAAQENDGKRGGGATLWQEFVKKSLSLLKDDGYLCFVHPCGWRSPTGKFTETKALLTSKQIKYLKIHNAKQGMDTFGVGTRYDWYVLQNRPANGKTIVMGEDEKKYEANLGELPFIPNGMFEEIMSLVAGDGEERVEVLHSYSDYESRKEWMSKEQNGKFQHPVIHSIKGGGLNLIYSDTKENGHFGIPKVVFGSGQSDTYIDHKGEYALTQHTRAIVDTPKNLNKINAALNSKRFIELSSYCCLISTGMFIDRYNKDILALFRKDFWKHFVDENGNEI